MAARAGRILQQASYHVKSAGVSTVKWYIERDCTLSSEQLTRLAEHEYKSQDSSYLENYMSRFWCWVVEQYPMWLAPNLITLLGLGVNVFACLMLACFSLDAKQTVTFSSLKENYERLNYLNAPWWTYLLCAIGLFTYQTLDATDGKQARRTRSSSPLGELFDHGCDSLSQVFVTLEICLSMTLGRDEYFVVYVTSCSIFMFHCAHWMTYVTGTLKFEKFDVTEAQVTIIATCLLTAIAGPELWFEKVLGIQIKYIVLFICFLGGAYQILGYFALILTAGVGRNGSTVAGTSVLSPFCPIAAVVIPHVMVYGKSTSGVFSRNIVLFCICFGFVAAKTTNRLVIAYMSRSDVGLWDWIYLSPIAMMLNQYYNIVIPEFWLLVGCTLYALASLLIYCYFICRQLCDRLRINCFSLSRRSV